MLTSLPDRDAHDCSLTEDLAHLGTLQMEAGLVAHALVIPAAELVGDLSGPGEDHLPVVLLHAADLPEEERIRLGSRGSGTFGQATHDLLHILVSAVDDHGTRPRVLLCQSETIRKAIASSVELAGIALAVAEPSEVAAGVESLEATVRQTVQTLREILAPQPHSMDGSLRRTADLGLALNWANPWRLLEMLDPPTIRVKGQECAWPCVMLFQVGERKCVLFAQSEKDAWTFFEGHAVEDEKRGHWLLSILPANEIDLMARSVLKGFGATPGPDRLLPLVERCSHGVWTLVPTGATREMLVIMAALTDMTDEQIDLGRWTAVVDFDGTPFEVECCWHNGIDPPTPGEWRRRGCRPSPDQDVAARLLASRIDRRSPTPSRRPGEVGTMALDGLIERPSGMDPSPIEQAELLWAKALRTHGRARRRLAERALSCSHDCAGAWRVLAEFSQDAEEFQQRTSEAIAAGWRLVRGSAGGLTWHDAELQPAMLMAIHHAEALQEHGRGEEAMALLGEILSDDPPCIAVRTTLALMLMRRGHWSSAAALMDDALAREERGGPSRWVRAVASAAEREDDPESLKMLEEAVRQAPVVGMALLKPHVLDGERVRRPEDAEALASMSSLADDLRPILEQRPRLMQVIRDVLDRMADARLGEPPRRRFKSRPRKHR